MAFLASRPGSAGSIWGALHHRVNIQVSLKDPVTNVGSRLAHAGPAAFKAAMRTCCFRFTARLIHHRTKRRRHPWSIVAAFGGPRGHAHEGTEAPPANAAERAFAARSEVEPATLQALAERSFVAYNVCQNDEPVSLAAPATDAP